MNELINYSNKLPTGIRNGLKRIEDILKEVNSWEDIERRFLYGAGMAKSSYVSIRSTAKTFFEWTRTLNRERKMIHPVEVDAKIIELYFDHSTETKMMSTAVVRISFLRIFYNLALYSCH